MRKLARHRHRVAAVAAVLGVACVFEVAAAINEWTNAGGTGSWADALNWSAQAVPQAGEALLFGDTGTSGPLALNGSFAAGSLNFTSAGPVTIEANTASGDWRTLRLTGGTNALGGTEVLALGSSVTGTVTLGQAAGHGALTVMLPIASSIAVPNAAATLVFGAQTSLARTPTRALNLTKTGAGTLVINGELNATSLTQMAGSLVLNAATQHAGPTTLTGGTLTVADPRALQYSLVTPAAGLQFAAGLGSARFAGLAGSGSLLLADTAGAPVSLEISGVTSTFSGVLSGPGGLSRTEYQNPVPLPAQQSINSTGATLTLSGANTYSGPTVVSGVVTPVTSFATVSIYAPALALDFTKAGAPANNIISASSPLVFGGANLSGGGALVIRNSVVNSQSFAGTTVAEGASFLVASQQSGTLGVALGTLTRTGGTLTVTASGSVSATANLTRGILGGWATTETQFFGTDWATLQGNIIVRYNNYSSISGSIPSNPAVNYLGPSGGSPASGVALAFGAGGATTDLHTLKTAASFYTTVSAGTSTGTLRFGASGGILSASGLLIVGQALDTGRVTAGGADDTPGELFVTGPADTSIAARLIDNGSGAMALSKSGRGTLILTDGLNSYTGGTVVNQGKVQANTVGAFGRNAAGTAGGDVVVKSAGVVQLGAGIWDNRFSISGNGGYDNLGFGALSLNGSTLTGDIRLVTSASFSSNGATSSTVSGVVSGPGTLQGVVNSFTQLPTIFTNPANSFTGGIGLRSGMLVFTTPGALSNDTRRNIFMSGGAIGLTFSGVQDLLNRRFVNDNAGALALSPANAAENIDLSEHGANLGSLSLGSFGDVIYTGTLTPKAGVYRLGGGSGTFTYARDLAGAGRVVIGQPRIDSFSTATVPTTTVLTGHNTYTGGTTFQGGTAVFASLDDFGSGPLVFTGGALRFAPGNTADISTRPTRFLAAATLDVGANNVSFANPIGGGQGADLTKLGSGTLTLNAPSAFLNATIKEGTLAANVSGALPLSAVVSLDGPTSTSASAPVFALGADQSVQSVSSTSAIPGQDISQILLNGHRLTFGFGSLYSAIRGTGDLVKVGYFAAALRNGTSPNGTTDFTGSLTVNGGLLTLTFPSAGFYTSPAASILPPSTPVSLGGGNLSVSNESFIPVTQSFDQLTLKPGANGLATAGSNSTATLAIGQLQRPVAGSTADFTVSAGSSITMKTANTAGTILGGWATFGGNQFAVSAGNGTTAGAVSGLASGGGSFAVGGDVDAAGTANFAFVPINSLRFNTAAIASVDASAGLQIASGGILLTSTQGTRAVSIDQGTITSGNGADLIVNGATGTALTINSKITGSVGLTKSGAGTLIVTNANNDFNGPVTINGGVLQVASNGALGNNAIAINGNGSTATPLSLAAGVILNNAITISGSNGDSAQGLIAAAGAATLNGPITITTETTGLTSGIFTGPLTVNGPITAPKGAIVSSRAGAVVLAGGGTYFDYAIMTGTTSLGAHNGISPSAVLDMGIGGTATFDLAGYHQTLAGLAADDAIYNTSLVNNTPTASILTLDVAAGAAWTAYTVLSGNLSLVKNGAGTQTLGKAQTYTGTTTINGGSLELNATTTTAVTVNAGGTLRGIGSVAALTVAAGGTVAPGSLPVSTFSSFGTPELSETSGTLRTGDLLMSAGAHLSLELGATTLSDALSVTGTLSVAGDIQLTLLPSFEEVLGSTFFIVLNDGSDPVSGTFLNGPTVSDSYGHVFAIDYADNGDAGAVANDISLTLVALPEPGSAALLGLAGLLLGARRRRVVR